MVRNTLSIAMAQELGLPAPVFGVRHHKQENQDHKSYCGAASAQMVLESIGAGTIAQNVLFAGCTECGTKDPNSKWHSAPDGLECLLNNRRPTGFTDEFKFWDLESEEAISRKLCWAIERGVAPIVATLGGRHWIVVVGYEATARPTSSSDTSYQIIRFDVFDPGIDDENHSIYYTKQLAKGAGEQRHWGLDVFTPVLAGKWRGKYVAICDTDPPATLPVIESSAQRDLLVPAAEADPLLDPESIRPRSTEGHLALGQDPREYLPRALAGAVAGEPILVEREDLTANRFFYLVPFASESGEVTVIASVDPYAGSGAGEIIVSLEGNTPLANALDREAVIARFAGQPIEVDGATVRLEADDLNLHLVWQPCAESLFPYQPFYRFDVGGPDSGIRVYVRIDGELFTELHVRGGM